MPVTILGVVDVLGLEPILFSSLSPDKNEDKASGKGFLEAEEAETLLEEHFAMWWVWGLLLKWFCLPTLKLVLERRFRESRDSPTYFELF